MRKLIDELIVDIPKDVYDPAEDSFLLAENVEIINHNKVLEVGSGSGYVSLYLAKKYPKADYFCLDINFAAAKATKENSKENNLHLEVVNCDLMSSFVEKKIFEAYFDIILFNTPYLPLNENGKLALAWSGGKYGLETTQKFIVQLPRILKRNGRCYIVVSSKTDLAELEKLVLNINYKLTQIDEVKEGRESIKLFLIEANLS